MSRVGLVDSLGCQKLSERHSRGPLRSHRANKHSTLEMRPQDLLYPFLIRVKIEPRQGANLRTVEGPKGHRCGFSKDTHPQKKDSAAINGTFMRTEQIEHTKSCLLYSRHTFPFKQSKVGGDHGPYVNNETKAKGPRGKGKRDRQKTPNF